MDCQMLGTFPFIEPPKAGQPDGGLRCDPRPRPPGYDVKELTCLTHGRMNVETDCACATCVPFANTGFFANSFSGNGSERDVFRARSCKYSREDSRPRLEGRFPAVGDGVSR